MGDNLKPRLSCIMASVRCVNEPVQQWQHESLFFHTRVTELHLQGEKNHEFLCTHSVHVCLAGLQAESRAIVIICESRERDCPGGCSPRCQTTKFLSQGSDHPLLTQNRSEVLAERQLCNAFVSPELAPQVAPRPYLCFTHFLVNRQICYLEK